MEYITHHRYKTKAMCGESLNLPYGTKLEERDNKLYTEDGKAVCFATSENAKLHFARNDDGKGLERGGLTYAIAYSGRVRIGADGRQQRFSDEEIETLEKDWSRWLRDDCDVILFNEDFFKADPYDLKRLAKTLGIKPKR